MLIATAGHVNHGKTSLIRALTGVDTDRLPEEKRRGLTIDLGFAYAERPNGKTIGYVDVPGHDHYLHNMISGVLPLDRALLVVAADEGPKPQTEEHLELLDLVGIRHLIAVITKIDRVDDGSIALAEARLRELLARTSFAGAKSFCVSSQTGAGIDRLQEHLDMLPDHTNESSVGANLRLPVDRAFTLQGIGVVVTGTIMSGAVQTGDRLVLTPSGLGARVRSLHAQNQPVSAARVGVRCAVAITGPDIEKDRIKRGDVLVAPRLHDASGRIGARLKFVDGVSLRNGKHFQLYYGTGRTIVRMTASALGSLGDGRLVELIPAHPLPVIYGDRVLLRDEIARRNIAGGIVVDPFLPARTIARDTRSKLLIAAAKDDCAQALAAMIDAAGVVDFRRFCVARNLAPYDIQTLASRFAADLFDTGDAGVIVSGASRALAKRRLVENLAEFHEKRPQVLGPRNEQALSYFGKEFAGAAARACLGEAIAEQLVVQEGACIRLKSHEPHLSTEDQQIWDRLGEILRRAQLHPPHLGAIAENFAMNHKEMQRCLVRFEQFGLLTRVAKNRFFLPETIDRFRTLASELVRDSDGVGFTAADFNKKSGVGRNLTIEVLEHLDKIGATKRQGQRRLTA